MSVANLTLAVVDERHERFDMLHQIALEIAAGAGALSERQQRVDAAAAWCLGVPPADHMKYDLLHHLLDELGGMPGVDAGELRAAVAETIAGCTVLRGAEYLERCTALLADAAAGVLTLARSLAPEGSWRRQELLGIASHLAWCAHKDGEQCAALHTGSATR